MTRGAAGGTPTGFAVGPGFTCEAGAGKGLAAGKAAGGAELIKLGLPTGTAGLVCEMTCAVGAGAGCETTGTPSAFCETGVRTFPLPRRSRK